MHTDLVRDFESFCLLSNLGGLEGSLKTSKHVLGEWGGRSNDDVEFALVLADELAETVDDCLGLTQSAVFGKNSKEIFRDVGDGALLSRLLQERLDTRSAVLSRKSGVGDEGRKVRCVLDECRDGRKLSLDLAERLRRRGECRVVERLRIFWRND